MTGFGGADRAPHFERYLVLREYEEDRDYTRGNKEDKKGAADG
jgi:hypothetical protein